MTRYTRVRLEPNGPFHFGGRGIGLEYSDSWLTADGLFSALCNVLAVQQGSAAVTDLLNSFVRAESKEAVPFRLTSLMPYAGKTYFLPYPMIGPPRVTGSDTLSNRKLFKGIHWLSQAVFQQVVSYQQPLGASQNEEPITIQSGSIWLTANEKQHLETFTAHDKKTDELKKGILWRNDIRPRVTVDRRASASAIYSVGGVYFNKTKDQHAGLYTVIEWLAANDTLRDQIQKAFAWLGETGLGGKRNSGFGVFSPAPEDLQTWNPGAATGDYFTTLAPYNPRASEQETIQSGSRYELILQRGWMSITGFQNVRRSSVRMIADGSLLHWPAQYEPLGRVVDVTPQKVKDAHGPAIFRYGLAFPVRVENAAVQGYDSQSRGAS